MNTTCLSDFQAKRDLNLNRFYIYVVACHMLVADWFNNEMQTTITLIGGPHLLVWHFSGKSHHYVLSTHAFLPYTTDTLQILAQYNLVQTVLQLDTKQTLVTKRVQG